MKRLILALTVALIATTAMAERKSVNLYIPGMECAHCQEKVENVLNHERGIKKLTVDLKKRIVAIEYDDQKTSVETIQKSLVKELNFKSMEVKAGQEQKPQCQGQCKKGEKGCEGHNHGECTGHDHDKAHDKTK